MSARRARTVGPWVPAPAAAVDSAKSEDELFAELYVSASKKPGAESPVPRFHYKLPSDDNVLSQKLREESRARFLERRNAELLDHDELKTLMDELANVSSPPIVHEKAMLNYVDFKKVSQRCGEKCRSFFTAKVFAKLLQKDPYGRISVDDFFNYVMKKVWMQQTRQGYLREADLESYIKDLIPTLPQINGIEQTFHSFYVCTACGKLRSDKLTSTDLDTNWFSATSALKVYGDYLHLDKTHNGMLSKSELARYGKGTLTQAFIDREQMRKHEQEPVKFEDVKDEIFDMVKPEDPCKITLKDLIRCGKGSTVVSILIDVNEFWAYDNRDTLAADV
ncbi:hypothetical protein HPB52_015960 [Rhipicephalus sanguineus]|uniref:EF-hand domain-containing protein n=1 Tax=Rhipicephalus sanguineus TaxID=34632 RepID=A0A9D4Q109_RHISA|nr:hypothetical protein HPB52_015960 [Rhipicephalus sanguineus]